MDRTVLASRLVEIAGDLSALAGKSPVVASEGPILMMARDKISYQLGPEMAATTKAVADLAHDFTAQHADLIMALATMEKAVDEKRDFLKAYYKTWKTETGYERMRKEVLAQAVKCLSVGDTLTDLADDLSISKRESEQESYKEKYNILVSTLNAAELKKYQRILGSFFSKQITELKTGVKELDGAVKDWHESAQAIAKERGIDLPKASVAGSRTAGILDGFFDVLKQIIPEFKEAIKGWVTNLWSRVSSNGSELDEVAGKLVEMATKANITLAQG